MAVARYRRSYISMSRSYIRDRLGEIYAGGTTRVPFTYEDLESAAQSEIDGSEFEHIANGAGTNDTLAANRAAFRRRAIVPRVLRGAEQRDLGITLFGAEQAAPIAIAPMSFSYVHDNGELAAAEAAAELGIPMVLNTIASVSMEDLVEQVPNLIPWFQLYWSEQWDLTASLVERAESAGYGAIFLTVDAPVLRWAPGDFETTPLESDTHRPNFFEDPVFRSALETAPEEDPEAAMDHLQRTIIDGTVTWNDLEFLRDNTSLPIVLKGILDPADAEKAVDCDVDGIVVSNHGGRQIDGEIAALDALPPIVDAVGNDIPVLFDSGVRTGADIFKALALGADTVLIGRPLLYGLAVGGREGAREVLLNMVAEFDSILGMTGHETVQEIDPDRIRTVP